MIPVCTVKTVPYCMYACSN